MVHLKVNGQAQSFDGDPEMPLLWYLRDILGLTGTKFGCGMALCGACTVLENGKAVRSCSTPMGKIEGADITTIEGISAHGPHAVQKAWESINVPQCGYCQPGQIMQAISLLSSKPHPTDTDIDDRCRAISAAAGRTSGFGRPFIRLRRRPHDHRTQDTHDRECEPARFSSRNAFGQCIRHMRTEIPTSRNCGEKRGTPKPDG